MDLINFGQYMTGILILLLMLGLFAWGMKKLATSKFLAQFTPYTGKRLSIIESLILDPKRRLILIRHDDKEHLLLIGGNTDLLIDKTIASDDPSPQVATLAPKTEA